MMKIPVTLGLVALLAACGGAGGPEEQAPVEPTPPEPVTFNFASNDRTVLTETADTFVFDGVTYNISDLLVGYENGNISSFFAWPNSLYVSRIIDGEASIAVAATAPRLDGDYVAQPFGSRFTVSTLENAPVGSATFSGDYVGINLQRGSQGRSDDNVFDVIEGDVMLNVDFAPYLSESSFSGVISNREFRDIEDGVGNRFFVLNDVIIENGSVDDIGQFTADISGGEWIGLDPDNAPFVRYETDSPVLIGQFGGENGDVAVGTLTLEHTAYETNVDTTGVETVDFLNTEIGGFVARQD